MVSKKVCVSLGPAKLDLDFVWTITGTNAKGINNCCTMTVFTDNGRNSADQSLGTYNIPVMH